MKKPMYYVTDEIGSLILWCHDLDQAERMLEIVKEDHRVFKPCIKVCMLGRD